MIGHMKSRACSQNQLLKGIPFTGERAGSAGVTEIRRSDEIARGYRAAGPRPVLALRCAVKVGSLLGMGLSAARSAAAS